jgi:hypothetical protein
MADRYCRNCGHEQAENNRFCTNCGAPVQQAAHVPTPEAETAAPQPPPIQQAQGTAGSEQGKVRAGPYWIAFVVLATLALAMGDNGTLTVVVASTSQSGYTAVALCLHSRLSYRAGTSHHRPSSFQLTLCSVTPCSFRTVTNVLIEVATSSEGR